MKALLIRTFFVGYCVLFLTFAGCGGKRGAKPSGGYQTGSKDSGEVWLATYLMGKKIGYGVSKYERVKYGFQFNSLSRLKLSMLGKTQSVFSKSRVFTDSDFSLRSFEFEFSSQDGAFKASGVVKDDQLIVNTHKGRQVVQLTRRVYPIEALGMVIVSEHPRPGEIRSYLTFDGTVLDTMPTTVEVLAQEELSGISTWKVKIRRAKFDVFVWLDGNGMTVKEESPLGINSVRVTAQEALAGEDGYTVDVLRLFAVPVDTVISEPGRIRRVVLEVSGLDTTEFALNSANQRVTGVLDSAVLVTVVVSEPVTGIRLPIQEEGEFLKPTVSVQSDAELIREKAKEIIGNTVDATEAARMIMRWVFGSLEKEAVASIPSALDVLKSMKGDCNEHSVLYAALCRAARIPAKVVVGLVYLDSAFYYHAWNEVYLKKWVPVDATFGEFPANCLRLRLSEGELSQQAEVLSVVRRIKIRVREFN